MGLTEAKQYIKDLRTRQENPYLWPDYLTGLPDKAAIFQRLGETYPDLGRSAVAYVRVANVHPYLLKYGADRHAEVVQWSAAILKTVADKHGRRNFVGALRTHDFIVIGRTERVTAIMKEAVPLFRRRALQFYDEKDRKNNYSISFRSGNGEVKIGLMKMVYVLATDAHGIPEGHFLPFMADCCNGLEAAGIDSTLLSAELVAARSALQS